MDTFGLADYDQLGQFGIPDLKFSFKNNLKAQKVYTVIAKLPDDTKWESNM